MPDSGNAVGKKNIMKVSLRWVENTLSENLPIYNLGTVQVKEEVRIYDLRE